jgi:adenine-specific DNA-methyltransferase
LTVGSNDIANYSKVVAQCFLQNTNSKEFYQPYIDILNNLESKNGWFSQNYGGLESDTKKPFQIKNMQKLDAIRDKIDEFVELDKIQKAVLLTSLLFALDKVESTLGHFSSYLKVWSKRSYEDLFLQVPDFGTFPVAEKFISPLSHQVFQVDAFEVVKQNFDLIYLDPPYGSGNEKMPPSRVRYQAYYHFWNTVILNDKPEIFGAVGRRDDSRDGNASVFEEFRKDENGNFLAINAVQKLIQNCNSKYVLLSYNSTGGDTQTQLFDFLKTQNVVQTLAINYKKNVMSQMTSTKEWLPEEPKYQEYLFLIFKP